MWGAELPPPATLWHPHAGLVRALSARTSRRLPSDCYVCFPSEHKQFDVVSLPTSAVSSKLRTRRREHFCVCCRREGPLHNGRKRGTSSVAMTALDTRATPPELWRPSSP